MVRALLALVVALLVLAPTASADTFEVGPGRTYHTLQDVTGLVDPGDVVLLDGGATYPGGVVFDRPGSAAQPITVRGVGAVRPVVSGATNTLEARADHYVFERLELTGGSFRCFYHHAHDVTLRDSVVHDCPAHGILGADNDSGSFLMDHVEVYGCGNGTSQHQVYMATDETNHPGSVFRMQHSYVHDATGGNNIKSRAERNEIYFNWVEDALYHELELIGPDPGGGSGVPGVREDSDVVGNVLVKEDTFSVVRFGGDGTGETNGRYRFAFNTVVTRPSGGAVFRLFDGLESVEMHGNVLYGAGGVPVNVKRTVEANWVSGSETISGDRNWVSTGSTNVPAAWTSTIVGGDPGFTDFSSFDLRPAAGSPLIGAGPTSTAAPPGYDFPSPLHPPGFLPPFRALAAPGAEWERPQDGAPDIGAFEYGATGPGTGTPGGGGPGPGGGSTTTGARPAMLLRLGRVRLVRRGKRLLVRTGIVAVCPAGGGTCSASVVGTSRRLRLGRASLRVRPGARTSLSFTLGRKAVATLRRRGKLRATLRATAVAPGTRAATLRRGATLRRPKR